MQEVRDILESLNCRIRYVDVAKLGLSEKGDVVDWLEMNPDANQKSLYNLPFLDNLSDAAVQQCDWSDPMPLKDE